MSHAGSEQDAIQGAFGRLQRARSWLSHYCIGPFSVVAAEVGKPP
jgi:hypothetical protein